MKHILLLIGILIAALPVNAVAAELTHETCDADYAAMVKAAEENRARSIAELEAALRLTSNEDAAGDLAQQIERTWELEESFLKHASNFYRDCVKHVESGGS
tara:strand:- start:5138 stop:5443 length:306 start_codon:yes stop_codon:yes gene_type:complete